MAGTERHRRESEIRGVTPLHATARINATVATQKQIGYWATRRGELVHAILSQLTFVSDPEASLEAIAHTIPDGEWAEIKPVLMDFLRTPEVMPFFAGQQERTVVNELDVVAREGSLFRVDRIVVDPTEVSVLDFKTGTTEDTEEYAGQIRRYMGLVKDIFPGRNISGFIAFVDRRVVRRVS
jgi:ATP-dependent exoDNAse (exonuclease V) beta subunit